MNKQTHENYRIKREVLRTGHQVVSSSKGKGSRRFTGSIVRVCLEEKGLY